MVGFEHPFHTIGETFYVDLAETKEIYILHLYFAYSRADLFVRAAPPIAGGWRHDRLVSSNPVLGGLLPRFTLKDAFKRGKRR